MDDKDNLDQNYEQNQLFNEPVLISDKRDNKKGSNTSYKAIVLTSSLTCFILLSGLYFLGFFEEPIIPEQETITITETIKEKELIVPRVDSSEIVSIAEVATKTIVQIQIGSLNQDNEFISQGGGSGVVLDRDGVIITNHHVLSPNIEIEGALKVRVIFEDGKMYGAEIIGSDKLTDIGLIKINADKLTPVSIGSSKELLVGDVAIAIGHPLILGAQPTVTTGIVSALERRLDVGSEMDGTAVTLFGLIQTDAPITKGSSGGALLNNKGELIGITTAIALSDIGAEGLGFAIPIDLVLSISKNLIEDGAVYHSFLGIFGSQNFGVANDGARVFDGVMIEELYGPANDIYAIGKAGALPGDIIKSINGVGIKTLDQMITMLRTKRAGEEVEITLLRESEVVTLKFQLDLRPSDI